MSSRAQRPLQSLISLRNAFGFKAVNSFNGKSMKEFDAEGALAARVPAVRPPDYDCEPGCDCPRSELEIGGRGHLIDCGRDRECEGCGERKPIDEMATVFLPGTGETYQCSDCRGGP